MFSPRAHSRQIKASLGLGPLASREPQARFFFFFFYNFSKRLATVLPESLNGNTVGSAKTCQNVRSFGSRKPPKASSNQKVIVFQSVETVTKTSFKLSKGARIAACYHPCILPASNPSVAPNWLAKHQSTGISIATLKPIQLGVQSAIVRSHSPTQPADAYAAAAQH
jgi:hypothetical protein